MNDYFWPEGSSFGSSDFHSKDKDHLSGDQRRELRQPYLYILQKEFYSGHQYQGDFLIAYSLEPARNVTYPGDGRPHWENTGQARAHIGIAVHDEADMRFVAGLHVEVAIYDQDGFWIGTYEHPLSHRPNYEHYGRNWILPGEGKYTLRVRVDVPEGVIRDEAMRKHYLTPVEVEFKHVLIPARISDQ